MIKKLSAVALASVISFGALASNLSNPTYQFIDAQDYAGLKKHLYIEQPNVLERNNGYSSLDYAIAKRDKRAAIIIADYNNSSINQRRLRAIELELSSLDLKVKSNSNSKQVETMISKLKAEKTTLKLNMQKEANKELNDRFEALETRIKELEKKAMPPEIKSMAIDSVSFLNEKIHLEKN